MFMETEISDYSEDYEYTMFDDNIDDIEYDLIYLEHSLGIIQEISEKYNVEAGDLFKDMRTFIDKIDKVK